MKLCFEQSARDSPLPQIDVALRGIRNGLRHEDVGNLQTTARLDHARHLAQTGEFVRERLSTPLEITTSAQPSGTGRLAEEPCQRPAGVKVEALVGPTRYLRVLVADSFAESRNIESFDGATDVGDGRGVSRHRVPGQCRERARACGSNALPRTKRPQSA